MDLGEDVYVHDFEEPFLAGGSFRTSTPPTLNLLLLHRASV